jgi:hypothetical protein
MKNILSYLLQLKALNKAVLFNEYGDALTDWISDLEVGIIMGEMKIDIIQYADDITLVADTARGLQTQMDKCKAYGEEYGIQFNPDKTTNTLLIFSWP